MDAQSTVNVIHFLLLPLRSSLDSFSRTYSWMVKKALPRVKQKFSGLSFLSFCDSVMLDFIFAASSFPQHKWRKDLCGIQAQPRQIYMAGSETKWARLTHKRRFKICCHTGGWEERDFVNYEPLNRQQLSGIPENFEMWKKTKSDKYHKQNERDIVRFAR